MVSTCNYLQYHLEISVVSFEETTNIVGHISHYLQFLRVYPILIHGRWNVASPKAAWTGPHEDSESQGALNVWKLSLTWKHMKTTVLVLRSGTIVVWWGIFWDMMWDMMEILVGYIWIYHDISGEVKTTDISGRHHKTWCLGLGGSSPAYATSWPDLSIIQFGDVQNP